MPKSKNQPRKLRLRCGSAAAVALLVIAYLANDIVLQATMFVVGLAILGYCLIRFAFSFGKLAGNIAVTTIGLGILFTAIVFIQCHLRINTLESELDEYVTATIQRNNLPFPHVYQLQVDDYVTDEELSAIIDRPEMKQVTHLYLESHKLTDRCLHVAEKIKSLKYVSIKGAGISEDQANRFKSENPVIKVLVSIQ